MARVDGLSLAVGGIMAANGLIQRQYSPQLGNSSLLVGAGLAVGSNSAPIGSAIGAVAARLGASELGSLKAARAGGIGAAVVGAGLTLAGGALAVDFLVDQFRNR